VLCASVLDPFHIEIHLVLKSSGKQVTTIGILQMKKVELQARRWLVSLDVARQWFSYANISAVLNDRQLFRLCCSSSQKYLQDIPYFKQILP
jgi:hypothetical protein